MKSLKSGEDIFYALMSTCDDHYQQIQSAAESKGAALQLEQMNPVLAEEFRRAATDHFGEKEDW